MATYDLIIRGGKVVDGSGAASRTADLAIDQGWIVEVGSVDGTGRREIDADGALVVPGYVDIHTHYDGQATWDDELAPSSWHGVTTVVAGNCGVGFAPVRAEHHDRLIELMEGVEDIPGTALHEGLEWTWESFGEYLDALDGIHRDIDLGTQIPHGALRLFVMGERHGAFDVATPEQIAEMARLAAEGIRAGALGFSTSRTQNHRTVKGEPTPSLHAAREELLAIARAIGATHQGVLQAISDFGDLDAEFALLREMAEVSGRPISISVAQQAARPDRWRVLLDRMEAAGSEGVVMRGQVAARAIGTLLSFHTSINPFVQSPMWGDLKAMSADERMARLRLPEVRRFLIDSMNETSTTTRVGSGSYLRFDVMFPLGDPPDYEPDPATSVAAQAAREGREPAEVAYDILLGDDGRSMLYVAVSNYVNGALDAVPEMIAHPASVIGLSDGGAHVGTICDSSFPTTLLQWWGRDRPQGRLPVELLVHKQTRATATAVGLLDSGLLAPGHRGDVNVIDFERLSVGQPSVRRDLPAGGTRLVQDAEGYLHTFVAGTEVRAAGVSTGARPGQPRSRATVATVVMTASLLLAPDGYWRIEMYADLAAMTRVFPSCLRRRQ